MICHNQGDPVYNLCIVANDGRNQFLIRRLKMAVLKWIYIRLN